MAYCWRIPHLPAPLQFAAIGIIAIVGTGLAVWWRIDSGEPKTINVVSHGARGDGAANDTRAIQSAIRSGHDLYFPAGRYLVDRLEATRPRQRWRLDPRAVVVQMPRSNPLVIVSAPSVQISGGVFDASRQLFEAGAEGREGSQGIIVRADGVSLEGLTVVGSAQYGVVVMGVSGTRITRSTVRNTGWESIVITTAGTDMRDTTVDRCHIDMSAASGAQGGGIKTYAWSPYRIINTRISDNIVILRVLPVGATSGAIGIETGSNVAGLSEHASVLRNRVVGGLMGVSSVGSHALVSANRISDFSAAGVEVVGPTTAARILDNTIDGGRGAASNGIWLTGAPNPGPTNTTIRGNSISQVTNGVNGATPSADVVVSKNRIQLRESAGASAPNGIVAGSPLRWTIADNTIDGPGRPAEGVSTGIVVYAGEKPASCSDHGPC